MVDALRTAILIVIAAAGAWTTLATGQPSAPAVTGAWARATPPGVDTAAAYFTLVNGSAPDRLLGLQSASARVVEIHETVEQGGVATMRRVDPLALAAGERVELSPRGKHLMLFALVKPLVPGAALVVTLRFEHAGAVEVTVPILDGRDAAPDEPHGHH